MNPKRMEFSSKDLISSLPDEIICHILSFLNTTEAASTSVLSKRWRLLLAFVPNLEFDNSIIYERPEMGKRRKLHLRKTFKLFADRVFSLQGTAPLNKCKIRCDPNSLNGWVLKVLERGVLDLDICISTGHWGVWSVNFWMSKSLVRLKVNGNDSFDFDVGQVILPKLKILHIEDVWFNDRTGAEFARLVSSCPVLEDLVLIKARWDLWGFCSVSNPSLKRVTIWDESNGRGDKNPKSVSFDTPNVVYLEYTDNVAVKYPKTNFGSLVEANIGIRMTPDQVLVARDLVLHQNGYVPSEVGDVADFLVGISNVKVLYLSSKALEVLTFCCKAIPIFHKLIHLTVETDQDVDWESMPSLLKNSPTLETLVFKGLHYGDTRQCSDKGHRFTETNECYVEGMDMCVCKPWEGIPSWLSSSPVKILKFGEIFEDRIDVNKQLDLVKHFVETMPNLEQVILYYETDYEEDVSVMLTEFHRLDKVASMKCEIQLVSDKISYSTTVYSSSSLTNEVSFFKDTFPV